LNIRTEAIIGIFIVTAIGSFLYMGIHLGAFRFDTSKYASYTAYFKDVAGLTKKADVKIAGVKVGWVDDVSLEPDGKTVRAKLMILRDYVLYSNAYAVIRQEGMLGLKFLELTTGDPHNPALKPGESLAQQQRQFVSLDEMIHSFQKVAESVQHLSSSLQETAQEVRDIARTVKGHVNPVAQGVSEFKHKVDQEVLPHLTASIDRIVTRFESTCDALKQTTGQVQQQVGQAGSALQGVNTIIEKINEGKGTLGKLINDDTMYQTVSSSLKKACRYVDVLSRCSFGVDSYVEPLIPLDHHIHPHVKGYVNLYFSPYPHFFLLGGVALSDKGFAHRTTSTLTSCDTNTSRKVLKEKHTSVAGNFQIGSTYKSLALRFGLFEGSLGVGVDWRLPVPYQWITSFEVFDFKGKHRIDCDSRPHLKWLNRFFVTPSFYVAFGAEDFISRHNKSLFLGVGLSFSDTDFQRLY
jgi:phospholipid/cholesterol/gamma-HCH transport system substrate-binding protein